MDLDRKDEITPAALQSLLGRIEVLERRESRRKRTAALALGGALLLLLPGYRVQEVAQQKDPATLRAGEFLLVDGEGRERARLGLENGSPQLVFKDASGTTRIKLGMHKGVETVLTLIDAKGRNRLGLAVDGADQPHLVLQDNGAKPRLHMAVSERGAPSLVFIREDGEMPAGMGIHPDGKPWSRPVPDGDKSESRPAK